VERQSRFVMLIKVPSRDTAEVVGTLSKHVRKLPATLRLSAALLCSDPTPASKLQESVASTY
jgi:hypothetical protein